MSRYILSGFSNFLRKLEYGFPQIFGHRFPPEHFCVIGLESNESHWDSSAAETKPAFSLEDLIGDGILWAVPKHRRTIEKRLKRKYGSPEYKLKILLPKQNLRVCNECGHDYEIGVLCPHCYKKVKEETTLMQEKIQEKLGLQPIEQEVVVLYEGEKDNQNPEFFQGKRIVEMKKKRPMWFSKNLIQKSTQQPAETKEIKPNGLG